MIEVHSARHGAIDVHVYVTYHGHWFGRSPAYLVDVVDCPRQFGLAVDDWRDAERPTGAVPADVIYPVWNRLADDRVWVHDDFGNLAPVRSAR